MYDNDRESNLERGNDTSDSVESRTEVGSFLNSAMKPRCQSNFFELAILNIDQPCDNKPRAYWQAADPINGFVFIANKGRCAMKVIIAQFGDRSSLIDTILPCQSKLFSSTQLMGFMAECIPSVCDPNVNLKCLGEAIIILNSPQIM